MSRASGNDRPRRGSPGAGGHEGPVPGWLVVSLLLAGVGLRVWILAGPLGALDSDEAIVGLMARRIPGEVPAFFWGQTYGGSQEAILAGVSFRIFGPTVLALKLVPMVLAAVSTWLTWRVGRRTIGERGARLGAALFWAAPAAFVWWSTKERGHYWATLVLGLVAVLLVLRLAEAEEEGGAPPGRWTRLARGWLPQTAVLGLAVGLGWWASAHIVLLAVPAVAWLVWRDRRYLVRLWAAFPTAVLGALPWIVASAREGWTVFEVASQPGSNGYLDHLLGFFAEGLPRAVGVLEPFGESWLPWGLGRVAYAVLLGGFLWALVRRPPGTGPLLAIGAAYPFLFALSPVVWWLEDARYLLFLGPVLSLLLAVAIVGRAGPGPSGSRALRVVGASTVVLALSAAGIGLMTAARVAPLAPDAPVPADLGPLIRTLERHGADRVFAHYWIAHRLTFESRERLVATPRREDRFPEADRLVREAPRPAYVFVRGSAASLRFLVGLEARGVEHRRIETPDGRFTVYLPGRRVPSEGFEFRSPAQAVAPHNLDSSPFVGRLSAWNSIGWRGSVRDGQPTRACVPSLHAAR